MYHHSRHPQSIDALCAIPSRYSNAQSTILTGSSDGLLRAVQLFPTKLLGVVADHGEFPIERIAVDMGGEGRWVGSVGHEEVLKLTDLQEVFEDDDGDEEEEGGEKGEGGASSDVDEDKDSDDGGEGRAKAKADENAGPSKGKAKDSDESGEGENMEGRAADSSDEEEPDPEPRKRKRKKERDPLQAMKRRKGKNEVQAEPTFFEDL